MAGLDTTEYDALTPVQWPVREAGESTERLFADGNFFTPNRHGRFIAVRAGEVASKTSAEYPFVLNTGRVRDQWHTMTRTGLSPRLSTHIAEPFVEIHPDDAAPLGLEQGCLAEVSTPHGSALLRVLINRGQQPGSLFAPIHWSAENSSRGRVGALVHAVTDPVSGQPEAKATPALVAHRSVDAYGFVITRRAVVLPDVVYWTSARIAAGQLTFMALDRPAHGVAAWARTLLPEGEWLQVEDGNTGLYRCAILNDDRLEAVLFVGPSPKLPGHEWLQTQFARDAIPQAERRMLLAGRPLDAAADQGQIVCVCFQVGEKRIAAAITGGAKSAEAIGRKLGAGTNCGSCVPELKRLVLQQLPVVAAE